MPPKVFLDEPYPDNVPVVGCCCDCNLGPSIDEEYVACLLEVAACGLEPDGGPQRPKIIRTLAERPALERRLRLAINSNGYLACERNRVERVIEKIARGLWNYDVGEVTGTLTATVRFAPIKALSEDRLEQFLTVPAPILLPEVGSRLMFKVLGSLGTGMDPDPWQVVQRERFAYAVDVASSASGRVKMILRDYLAAEVDLAG